MPRKNTSYPSPPAKQRIVKPFAQPITQIHKTPSPPAVPPAIPMVKPPSLGSTLLQGISLGVGSSIGHRIGDSLFGKSNNTNLENENAKENRQRDLLKNYHECVNHSNGTMEEKEQCERIHRLDKI